MSSANDSRDKNYLLGCLVKCIDTLNRFAWLDAKCSGPFGAFLRKDTLRLAYSSNGFEVALQHFLLIPVDTIVAASRHHP